MTTAEALNRIMEVCRWPQPQLKEVCRRSVELVWSGHEYEACFDDQDGMFDVHEIDGDGNLFLSPHSRWFMGVLNGLQRTESGVLVESRDADDLVVDNSHCVHGYPVEDCAPCMIESDLAYDAAREDRRFGR